MSNKVNNISDLSNQEIFQLRKAGAKVSEITIKVGSSTYKLSGIDATLLKANGVTFLSVPTIHAMIDGKEVLTEQSAVKSAIKKIKSPAKKVKTSRSLEVPADLAKAIEAFNKQSGGRIVSDAEGGYKFQLARKKRK